MRVVIVTESFPPDVNGVAHCTLQTARHLAARGHQPLVIAPAGATATTGSASTGDPCPVVRVPSLPLPGYPQVRVALPGRRLATALTGHRAGLVHLAGPFVLGVRGWPSPPGWGCPPWPSTGPTWPATPAPTWAPARTPPGAGCAPCTAPPTSPSPPPPPPCATSPATGCPG
nr:glycosyltransferase [Streptomyces sp. NBC_01696]